MTPTEAVTLCRLVKGACPQQAFDQYTPDMWAKILADVRFVDAEEAVVRIVARSPWCSPSEIIAEVKKMRAKRIEEFGPIHPPADIDPDNWRAFQEWLASTERQIADGELKPVKLELPERNMAAIEGAFQRVPRSNR